MKTITMSDYHATLYESGLSQQVSSPSFMATIVTTFISPFLTPRVTVLCGYQKVAVRL